ncbi:MAG TPA: AraC family transcriptional regulator [Chitinophagaceae bacterium]|nr:AraC family transcriptional regulator [Chitinophagaceae bacterium]
MPSLAPILLMDEFPDVKVPGFNFEAYNKRFLESNVLIHAKAKEIFYAEHWGPMSIKCAFNGNEVYELGSCRYRVDDQQFLVLNEGQTYTSYIHATTVVESMTVNFSRFFVQEVWNGNAAVAFSEDRDAHYPVFCERLYQHNSTISPYLQLVRTLSREFQQNRERIEELFFLMLHAIFQLQEQETKKIQQVKAVKASTRKELYQRLMRARDHIESCYAEDVSLETLAAASCLNAMYLLRQFKIYFGVTPRQYAIRKRMTVAEELLKKTDLPVTEICYVVGYNDLTSFTKLFKQFYHYAPTTYRLQHEQKSQFSPDDARPPFVYSQK